MTINEELREIEKTLAESCLVSYEPQLLRIATEYRELLKDAVDILDSLCNGRNVRGTARQFLNQLEGENNDT